MLIAGVDEVGYGALVGDVVAAAVILPPKHGIVGIKDSKQLTPAKRDELFGQICAKAVAWNIAAATHAEIDQLNILNAALLAMQRAVNGLLVPPDKVLVDGNRCPDVPYPVEAIVAGDATIEQISAASIIAKVWRDRVMIELDKKHPEYGFAAHKGYSTAAHMAAIQKYGPLKEHRRSFSPVAEKINELQAV
ncbi:MAG TPA: ribonuclease HII [Gammaproteobacteria bacterium]|nr:ribonuclease HII [Gammaproteobacteria bacterium]